MCPRKLLNQIADLQSWCIYRLIIFLRRTYLIHIAYCGEYVHGSGYFGATMYEPILKHCDTKRDSCMYKKMVSQLRRGTRFLPTLGFITTGVAKGGGAQGVMAPC